MGLTPRIVAEAACNHCGSMDIAERMIETAASFCKADCIKFQKRSPEEMLSEQAYSKPPADPDNAYGETNGAHHEFLEFDLDQHKQLLEWCEKYGIQYASSVWDMTSAREVISLRPDFIKIPSALNTHHEMLRLICDTFGGQIHVATGMTTDEERNALLDLLADKGRLKDTVVYKCTSAHPVPFEDCHLPEIADFVSEFGDKVTGIGFSGHHLGIAIDNAAYALGARWFERCFTLDRASKGAEHAASLEPNGLRRLCRDLRAAEKAMAPKPAEIQER